MPRFDNSANSPQPCQLMVVLHGLRRRYKPSQSGQFIIRAIPTLQEHAFLMAYIILCLRFTLVVRLFVEEKKISNRKVFAIHNLRTVRKTRYRWLARPYPTGTYTQQDAPSLTCRTNASRRGAACVLLAEFVRNHNPHLPQNYTHYTMMTYLLSHEHAILLRPRSRNCLPPPRIVRPLHLTLRPDKTLV